MQSLKKPDRDTAQSPGALLLVLTGFYDAIRTLLGTRTPDTIPALKAITLPTHLALRNQIGDYNGQLGPRAAIVTGRSSPLDGGQGIYVWDATSTLVDDDSATIQPLTLLGKPGRWRKGTF